VPQVRGALIERHAGGAERVTEVARPIERAFGVADQTGRHGRAAHVDRTPVAQTLEEGDELVEVSLQSRAPARVPIEAATRVR
jgi:hypothetical protein